jgi:hypothetical protein
MAQTGSVAVNRVIQILSGNTGLLYSVQAIGELAGVLLPPILNEQIHAINIATEVVERSSGVKYPGVYVYCDRVKNTLKEKFRTFSGQIRANIEVRVSHDRLEGVSPQLQLYVDAITSVLDNNRGDWGDGSFFGGGYEINYGQVKHGGKNFVQTARVSFELEMSR